MELPAWGLAKASVYRSRRGDKPAFPGREGWKTDVAGSADLKAVAASSFAPCNFPSHGTWLAELGQVVRGHKEQPTVTAVTLFSLGAPDWLTPALHPHGDHRGG